MESRIRRRARARREKSLLVGALSPFRALFLVGMVAAARALGGHREIEKPPAENPAVEVARER